SKGVTSPLKLQKLLFFIRYEELKNKTTNNSFFKKNKNFQAWIYGPVNFVSYRFMQKLFMKLDEKDTYILSNKEIKLIDKKYKKYFDKWNEYSPEELIEKSHKNLAWIKARKGIDPDCPSREILEEDEDFLKFKNENN
ncbi:MAG: DUF4065 domain-containing protein, partial [Malacoplasma sp.]|nr:DUF4065 domain-containing protein [Malacoplasma sp.]